MEDKKSIDEKWKEAVDKEKENPQNQGKIPLEAADFNFFTTTLALQAAIFLGALENPTTNKKEENLPQARFIIDTLEMLQSKTKGNLTNEESAALENILYELRLQYIAKNQEGEK